LSAAGLLRSLELSENAHQSLENEIQQLNAERSELIERLNTMTRQKNALVEEVTALRRETERHTDIVTRINKEKESLTKSCAELVVQLTAAEKQSRQHSEVTIADLPQSCVTLQLVCGSILLSDSECYS
jgi:chromosome segregation ATPase